MPKPTFSQPEKPQSRYLKSELVAFSASESTNVDKEAGIISNVILCQVGPAKGHGVHLEQEFIDAGIAYAQKHWAKVGLKSRFGHPNMSNDALGTECGRFRNFRVEEDKMVADLHLYDSANLSPTHPGMKDWLLSMAAEDPNAIMCSIVFTPDHYYVKNEEGEKLKLKYNDRRERWETEDGESLGNYDKFYVALRELQATDIVDEGAATEKLFSAIVNKDKFAVIATEFFDQHPEVLQFLKDNPDKFPQFVEVYDSYRQKKEEATNKSFMKKILLSCTALLAALKFSGKTEEEMPESLTAEQVQQLNSRMTELETELSTATSELSGLKEEKEQWSKDKAALETKLADAEKQSKANLELAEQYRAAAGEGFSAAEQKETDKIPGGEKETTGFSDYDHNKEALAEISNL